MSADVEVLVAVAGFLTVLLVMALVALWRETHR